MPIIVKSIGVAASLVLTLSACSRSGADQDEMGWARKALDRNAALQVVASDPQAKTFTVRWKDSNRLVVVPVGEVVAGPAAATSEMGPPESAASQGAEGAAMGSAGSPGSGAGPSGAVTPPNGTSEAMGRSPGSTAAAAGEPAEPPAPQVAPGESSESGSGSAVGAAPAKGPGPHAESAASASAGSMLASGPGYSIQASGQGARSHSARPTAARDVPVERLHEPIICQGSRLLHIDNRNLEFDGDAVSAQDGCEIHITNSHISAKGIGVLARAANVHIENSDIEGDSGAIDASDGAQVYAESSRFKGLTRRMESSAFHDLGGNIWN